MTKMSGKEKKPDGRRISKKLSPKRRRFVANFTDPTQETFGNATRSAAASGYSPLRAKQTGHELVTNRDVRAEVERTLREAGATREKAARVLTEAMDANNVRVFCPGEGELVYSDPLVDHPTRLKAAEMTHKLLGDFPTQSEQERRNLLIMQQNILIVPPDREPEKDKPALPVRKVPD